MKNSGQFLLISQSPAPLWRLCVCVCVQKNERRRSTEDGKPLKKMRAIFMGLKVGGLLIPRETNKN